MTHHPTTPPVAPASVPPAPTMPPPPPSPDSLTRAKQRLLDAGEDVRPVSSLLHRHPYASAAAALAAGLLISRMPVLRKLAGIAIMWGLKRGVRQAVMRQMGQR